MAQQSLAKHGKPQQAGATMWATEAGKTLENAENPIKKLGPETELNALVRGKSRVSLHFEFGGVFWPYSGSDGRSSRRKSFSLFLILFTFSLY